MMPTDRINRITCRSLAFALLLLSLFCAAPRTVFADADKITDVRVVGLNSMSIEDFLYLIDLKPGDAIDPKEVTRGIKRAFRKGVFEDITVEKLGGGAIVVNVIEREYIDKITVHGNSYLPTRVILGSIFLKSSGQYRDSWRNESIEKLRLVYSDRGFDFADISIVKTKTKMPGKTSVSVRIVEGKPLIVQEVKIYGVAPEEVSGMIPFGKGDVFDRNKLRKSLTAIQERFKERGYLNPIAGPYAFKDGVLDVNVYLGKRLEIEVHNSSSISVGAILNVMPFAEAGDFRDDLMEEAIVKISALYHSKGFPFVKIATIVSEKEELTKVTFFIDEGVKVKVGKVSIEGANIGVKNIKKIISIDEGDIYNPDRLELELKSIEVFYMALGYTDVSVEQPKVNIKGSVADIEIKIIEGKRVLIKGILIQGAEVYPEKDILKLIGIKDGDSYNEIDIADARYRVVEFYEEKGYIDCRVDVKRDIKDDGAHIAFIIVEGAKVTVGKTLISGNYATKLIVLKREMKYAEGQPLSLKAMSRTRQGLYRLGLFTLVNTEIIERYDGKADIALDVEEGKFGAMEVGAGYGEYELFRGFVNINYSNLFGMNRRAGLRMEFSSLESRYILDYTEPWIFGKNLPLKAVLLTENRWNKNIDNGEITYKIDRTTASVGTEKKLGRLVKGDIYYEYTLVNTYAVKEDVVLTREDSGTLAISGIKPSLIYDSRDNAFDPKSGYFAGLTVKGASGLIFSETDFLKATVQGSAYFRTTRWLVTAVSVRGGVAKGFKDTASLPLVERFFLGGRTTVRGYGQDSLGPKGTSGSPLGGNAFVLGNFELRFLASGHWSVVWFLDSGNVWQQTKNIHLSELKYTTGAGLRYNTPVGPIRVDYGHKLNREAGESRYEIHFSIGHAF